MTEQSNAYHQKAYLATLQNYNRQEGDTTLADQGWVNELNVRDSLTPTNANNDDKPNPNNWSGKTGLKALTSRSLGKAYHNNSMAKTGWKKTRPRRKRRQRGGKFDLQKAIEKTGIEFHIPSYRFACPWTHLAKHLKHGDKPKNLLDKIATFHDIAYSKAKNLQDKWKADVVMIKSIDRLPGKKTKTEWVVKRIMQGKRKLKL